MDKLKFHVPISKLQIIVIVVIALLLVSLTAYIFTSKNQEHRKTDIKLKQWSGNFNGTEYEVDGNNAGRNNTYIIIKTSDRSNKFVVDKSNINQFMGNNVFGKDIESLFNLGVVFLEVDNGFGEILALVPFPPEELSSDTIEKIVFYLSRLKDNSK